MCINSDDYEMEEELTDEELENLPISIVVDGEVKTFKNSDEMFDYLAEHDKNAE